MASLFSDENFSTNVALRTLKNLQSLSPQTRFIRFQWQDLSGVLRARVARIEYALQLANDKKNVRISPVGLHSTVSNHLFINGCMQGMQTLMADWSSMRIMKINSSGPSYATVMCGILRNSPGIPLQPSNICPRGALANVIRKASEEHGVSFLVGFEVEFEIVKIGPCGNVVSESTRMGRYSVDGMLDPCFQYVEEAVQEMVEAGVLLQEIHTEGSVGQYEITVAPLPPLQAVDQLILVHDTLKRVFARHNLIANMSPVSIASAEQGTGQHTHISINPPIKEEAFLAGILKRLAGLCAFTLPHDVSYVRVKALQAGEHIAWGTHARQTTIRKMNPGHWELRCVDSTANMYLSLASVFSAGLLGYQAEEALVWPDMALESREKLAAESERMPHSVDSALSCLDGISEELQSMMESSVVQHYLEMKRWELSLLRNMDPKDVRALLVKVF